MGSGPFMFKRDEWVPGNKVVFVRNPHYVARSDAPNGAAGSKKPNFDRVEWLYIPDANSAVAALKKGEVDLIEQVPPDYINPLRADPNIRMIPSGSWQGWIVMNQLHPPFNNLKVRQAVLKAVNQDKFMAAMGYPKDLRVTQCATFFICGSPNETFAGAEPWRTPDIAKAKQLLAEAGYKGEKVVLLVPSDITYLNAEALMAAQTLRSIGMNVDAQTSDWATIGGRRAKKDAPEAGGWNMYVTVAGSFDADSPITNAYLGAVVRHRLARLAVQQGARRAAHRLAEGRQPGQAQGAARQVPHPGLRGAAVHQRRPVLAGGRGAEGDQGRRAGCTTACRWCGSSTSRTCRADAPPMNYVLRRLAATLPVMAVVAVVVFLLIHLSPGDPAALIAGDLATTDDIDRLRVALGLDKPLPVQFVGWVGRILSGDLGTSIFTNVPVTQLLAQRLEPTLSIAVADDDARGAALGAARHARRAPRRPLDRPRGDAVLGARLLGAGVPGRLPADVRLRDPASTGCRCRATRRSPTASARGCAAWRCPASTWRCSTWRCSRA